MSQGRTLDLCPSFFWRRCISAKDVASHGVPMKASTDGRSKKFAIAIAKCQRTKRVWRSNNPSIVIDVRGLGDEDSSTLSKVIRERYLLPTEICKH